MSDTIQSGIIEMRDVSIVAMRDLSKLVLDDVNWTVAQGDFWVVGGLQRSGKSDLLVTMAGLMFPAEGDLRLFGQDPRTFEEADLAVRLRLGVVFDGGQLFNYLTVAENVALPLRYHKNLAPNEAAQMVQAMLEMLELTALADVTPANLTTSWRQRTALARALIMKPEVLLLDNPLRGVGARHSEWWLNFLEQLRRGHDWFHGRLMTIVAAAEDLRPWRGEQRQFAILKEQQFFRVGSWGDVEASTDLVLKELLAAPVSATV